MCVHQDPPYAECVAHQGNRRGVEERVGVAKCACVCVCAGKTGGWGAQRKGYIGIRFLCSTCYIV